LGRGGTLISSGTTGKLMYNITLFVIAKIYIHYAKIYIVVKRKNKMAASLSIYNIITLL